MDRPRFPWRTALALWLGGVLGAVSIVPYAIALDPAAIEKATEALGVSVAAIVALSIVQSSVLLGLLTFSGLWAARRVGIGAPLLETRLESRLEPGSLQCAGAATWRWLRNAAGLGLAAGGAIIALDVWIFSALDPEGMGALEVTRPSAWRGLLASVYGGVAEEIQLRLFLMSFIALGFARVARGKARAGPATAPGWVFWVAIVVTALVFGLGHLPATAALLPLTPLLVVRAVVLNGIVGVLAGWLYWRRGIEAAMVCHFSADIVLHVLFPLLG